MAHKGEEPFSNELCNFSAASDSNFNENLMMQIREETFSCDLCNYNAAQNCNHIITLKREEPFDMESYNHILENNGNEQLIPTGDKPFSCYLCKYSANLNCDHNMTYKREKPFGEDSAAPQSNFNKQQLMVDIDIEKKVYACDLSNCSETQYCKHTMTHKSEEPLALEFGQDSATLESNSNDLQLLAHTDEKLFVGDLCNNSATQNYHHMKFKKEEPFVNESCNYTVFENNLYEKLILPTGEKLHNSGLFNYSATQNCKYTMHKKEEPLSFELSDYNVAPEGNFNVRTGKKSYSCNYCPYIARRSYTLKQHIMTHTKENPFSCNFCPYKTQRRYTLNQHIMSHTGEKPFVCNICNFSTARERNLKRHMLTHSRETMFPCNVCTYHAPDKHILKQHALTHNKEKPFACNLCKYTAVQKSHLKEHLMTHSGEKPFSCNFCVYSSVRKCDLVQHMKTHRRERPFSCNLCDYRSTRLCDLNTHISRHFGISRHFLIRK